LAARSGRYLERAPKRISKIITTTGENPLMARSEDEFAKIFAFVMADPPFIPRPILNVIAQERIRNYELEKRILKEIAADSAEKYVAGLKIPALIVFAIKIALSIRPRPISCTS